MRLEKFLAESGLMSRRAAKKSIAAGRITVNTEPVLIPGTHIQPETDCVEFDGKRVEGTPKSIYLMLNKPAGYLTTRQDERGRPTVMDLVRDISDRIYPVGRLDLDTEGLLLMTNDGPFAHRLTHPSHEIEKTYLVWVEGQPSQSAIHRLREGIVIETGQTSPAKVIQIGRRKEQTQFKIVIHEGKKRQIRRMFEAVGHKVTHLKRIQIGRLSLGELPVGRYRLLTPAEVDALRK
jgi:23S rRNA pseudouridine2605 synthase